MITIPATDLANALKGAAGIVETKNTLPILAMVRLSAQGDTLELVTSNLDIEYRQTIAATVTEPFECAVDAKRLLAMASAASGDMVLSPLGDNGVMTIKAGRSRWAAPTLPVDDFPLMPVDALKPAMKMPGATLASIIQRTAWSASTEQTRAYLGGVFLNNDEGKARWVATNGYTLASIATSAKWPKGAPDVIVPSALANVIAGAASGEVTLEWDDRKLRMTGDGIVVTGKMIEGDFPDYRRVIPAPCEPMAVDADDLLGAVRRVRIASDAQTRKLRVTRGDGLLSVRIEGTSGFEGSEDVPAECAAGFESGVNADYLVTMLAAMDTDSITIEQADANAPFLMKPVTQSPDVSFVGVVMGMRV